MVCSKYLSNLTCPVNRGETPLAPSRGLMLALKAQLLVSIGRTLWKFTIIFLLNWQVFQWGVIQTFNKYRRHSEMLLINNHNNLKQLFKDGSLLRCYCAKLCTIWSWSRQRVSLCTSTWYHWLCRSFYGTCYRTWIKNRPHPNPHGPTSHHCQPTRRNRCGLSSTLPISPTQT